MELLKTIEIPLYIKHVEISKKRRAKYYKKTSKKAIPKRYAGYKYSKKGILVHPDGTPVIANPRSVGTPRVKKINGQEIYSGMPYHMRSKIVKSIKESFIKTLSKTDPIKKFPVQIEMELHAAIGKGDWDLDNLWIYGKCFQDALTEAGIIPEDNIKYITKPGAPEFVPIENDENRKFVFRFLHDQRKIITSNKYFDTMSEENF